MRQWIVGNPGILGKSYYFASIFRRTRGHRPVLVWSLGKVGTTSLMDAIATALHRPVIHCHRVTRESATRTKTYRHQPLDGKPSRVAWRGEYVRHAIALSRRGHTWDIVCGVRDPIARCVSTVFQDGEKYGWFDETDEEGELQLLTDRVAELFTLGRSGVDWFSVELAQVTGIDVYSMPFDSRRGYQIYKAGRFRVLLIRFEDLERVGAEALEDFFQISTTPEIKKSNIGAAKAYAQRYRTFLDRARIPAETLNSAYSSPLATHFYSPEELAGFRARWSKGS